MSYIGSNGDKYVIYRYIINKKEEYELFLNMS